MTITTCQSAINTETMRREAEIEFLHCAHKLLTAGMFALGVIIGVVFVIPVVSHAMNEHIQERLEVE